MTEKTNELLRNFNRIDKEFNDIYHEVALKMGISDSAFSIFYILHDLGDGCLQIDIANRYFIKRISVTKLSQTNRRSIPRSESWSGRAIFI